MTSEAQIQTHVGELKLRRLRAGESVGDEAAAHAAACPQCRARSKELDDEQRRFEQTISFDRFTAGVERAARRPAALPAPAPLTSRARWTVPALGAAAALALVVTFSARHRGDAEHNRSKGGADVVVYVGGGAAQRIAGSGAPEALAPGERIRIGYKAGAHRYLTAVSLDDHGAATALYPESGSSLALPRDPRGAGETHYLPDSVELLGAGAERVVVVLSDQPLEVAAVKRAAERAYRQAKGDILRLPPLELAGEQFHRTFLKPKP